MRGAGKGLLAQTIGHIALGHEIPVSSYARDSEEMRKVITTIAIRGDAMVLLDNIEGTLGNAALDRALTATRWKDRILGKNQQVDLPLTTCWYATGNNVTIGADTARRCIHIRLDVLEERPEERRDFKHPELLNWIGKRRGELLAHALTILIAYRITDFAEIARLSQVTRARVTQIMNLNLLAPDIQEALLDLPLTTKGRDPIREHAIRPIGVITNWRMQRRAWDDVFELAAQTATIV